MKRLFTLFVLATYLISCEGPIGPAGEDGESVYWDIQTITVNANEWVRYTDENGLNTYYMCEKSFPALTNYVYEYGNTSGYMFVYYGNTEVQVPLPYTIPYENLAGDQWTEIYSFDFTPGSIAFYVHYSDFADIAPPTQVFRIVLAS